jgi:WD40 repeat protein
LNLGEGSELRETAPVYDAFFIYADADASFVKGYLLPELGLRPDRVLLSNELGTSRVDEIERGVTQSTVTIAILSQAYLSDCWAIFGGQLAGHADESKGRLIPLLLGDCKIPLHLDFRVAVDFRDPARWREEAARLRRSFGDSPPSARADIPCPYPGMRPFSSGEADRFFGRAKLVEEFVSKLQAGEREIYVIGPSGSGKSSLVVAGVLPRLVSAPTLVGGPFLTRMLRPGAHPMSSLSAALGDPAATSELVPGAVERLLASTQPAGRLVLIIDQLEEIFALADAAGRAAFVAALRVLRADPRCIVVSTLRADFYDDLMDSELWSDLDGHLSRVEVVPLRGPALAEAIEGPARRVGVFLEPRLCERLATDAANEPGALPLLQEALLLLWQRREQRLLRLADYEALGEGERSGLAVAISRRADAAFGALTARQQSVARRVFLRLVSFGQGRADTRRQQTRSAVRTAADAPGDVDAIVATLAEARLVTMSHEGGEDVVDLAHEALLSAWPTLRTWIDTRRADEERRRRLEAKVGEWVERERGATGLLDRVQLGEAEQWLTSDAAVEIGYSEGLQGLVAASRAAIMGEERQRKRRARSILGGLLAFSLVVSVLGALAWVSRQREHEEADYARRMLGTALEEQGRQFLMDGRPMRALPLLVAAREVGVEGEALRMLFAAAERVPRATLRHASNVLSARFSPDGRRVVTTSDDKTARVWDAVLGEPLTPPLEHPYAVTSAHFSPDGARVVTTSSGTARIWDSTTGKLLAPPFEQPNVVAAWTNSDGRRVVTASKDNTARVWDLATGRPLTPSFEHASSIRDASFSPDDTRVVTASDDRTARIWDSATGRLLVPPLEHGSTVDHVSFSANGTRVLTASADGTVRVWAADTGLPLTPAVEPAGFLMYATIAGSCTPGATFSEDGQRIATFCYDNSARVWDANTGKPVSPPLLHEDRVNQASFSRDNTRLLTASQDGTARVWDAVTGELLSSFEHQLGVLAASFSPDNARVVTASADHTARVWDVTERQPRAQPLNTGLAVAASISPNGQRVVTIGGNATGANAILWDASTRTPVVTLAQKIVQLASFSRDGRRLVTGGMDHTARVWDGSTGEPITPPLSHPGVVLKAELSPTGMELITSCEDRSVRIWDATTGELRAGPLQQRGSVLATSFLPNGARVLTASDDGGARVWDARTGEPLAPELEPAHRILSGWFSPDGRRLITASDDSTASVWDALTGKPVTPLLKHQDVVSATSFSPDGTHIVTASNRTARVWDAITGDPTTPPMVHQNIVFAASFSPDGSRILTASADHTARVWDALSGKPLTPALEHSNIVVSASFSPDGTQVVTASYPSLVWAVPLDARPLETWRAIARCSPFMLVNGVLTNRDDTEGAAQCSSEPLRDLSPAPGTPPLEVHPSPPPAIEVPDAGDAREPPTPGCARATGKGLSHNARSPDVAACAGAWVGTVDHGGALCAVGWHVCTGLEPAIRSLPFAEGAALPGCFAFDAAQDNGQCHPGCMAAVAAGVDSAANIDMAGLGAVCPWKPDGPSCILNGRIDASENSGTGCNYRSGLTGVVCCRGDRPPLAGTVDRRPGG